MATATNSPSGSDHIDKRILVVVFPFLRKLIARRANGIRGNKDTKSPFGDSRLGGFPSVRRDTSCTCCRDLSRLERPSATRVLLFLSITSILALIGCARNPAAPAAATTASASASTAIVTKSGVRMVRLPGGTFTMGSDHGDPDEAPAHRVTVTAFAMDACPVTHEMFAKAQIPDPSHWQDNPKGPVERVRWRGA